MKALDDIIIVITIILSKKQLYESVIKERIAAVSSVQLTKSYCTYCPKRCDCFIIINNN